MTNMPTDKHYWFVVSDISPSPDKRGDLLTIGCIRMFGIVLGTVCVPFFVLIGSMNTNKGMHFWRSRTKLAFEKAGRFIAWMFGQGSNGSDLVSVKSYESDATGASLRRWSSNQGLRRGQDYREPVSREDAQVRDEVRPTRTRSRTLSTEVLHNVPDDQTSAVASMWSKERRRRLTYSEKV